MNEDLIIVIRLICFFILSALVGMVVYAALFLQSPDPGYGYRWKCDGPETVIRYAEDDGGSYMAGKACKRVER